MRTLALLITATILAGILAVPTAGADHDEWELGLVRSPIMRLFKPDPLRGNTAIPTTESMAVPAVARNLVTLSVSGPVDVCAASEYDSATRQAVVKWNDSLRTNNVVRGRDILRYAPGGVFGCPATTPQAYWATSWSWRQAPPVCARRQGPSPAPNPAVSRATPTTRSTEAQHSSSTRPSLTASTPSPGPTQRRRNSRRRPP